jgi:hypothetical protein
MDKTTEQTTVCERKPDRLGMNKPRRLVYYVAVSRQCTSSFKDNIRGSTLTICHGLRNEKEYKYRGTSTHFGKPLNLPANRPTEYFSRVHKIDVAFDDMYDMIVKMQDMEWEQGLDTGWKR